MKNEQTVVDFDIFEENVYGTKNYSKRKLSAEDKKLMEMYDSCTYEHPSKGDVKTLKLVNSNKEYFLFEGNFKDFVRIDNKPSEFKFLKNIEIGQMVDVLITETNEKEFMIKGSVSQIYNTKIHNELSQMKDGEFVVGRVNEMKPAGYSVTFTYLGVELEGFMPNTLAGINRLARPEAIVGDTMELAIESYSREEGTYIVSRRRYLQSLIPEAISKLSYGDCFIGEVTGTTDFGVFVEFNECLTGMIYKSNLNTDDYNIEDIKAGMRIEFYVKEIIKNKIILTQDLRESLWDTISEGDVLSGIVKENKQFGALVMLDGETVGLIPAQEIEAKGKQLSNGQTIKVKVVSLDRLSRKISLSL